MRVPFPVGASISAKHPWVFRPWEGVGATPLYASTVAVYANNSGLYASSLTY